MNNQTFKFDEEKAIAAIKLILKNLGGKEKFHKLFKILYFADQKHLATYGRPILGDEYIAMQNGPVPSAIYDMLKMIKGEGRYYKADLQALFSQYFSVDGHEVTLSDQELDLEVFSESEIDCILSSLEENKFLSYGLLVDKSHDSAWNNASHNHSIQMLDIAKAGGANDELLKYIALGIENEHLSL